MLSKIWEIINKPFLKNLSVVLLCFSAAQPAAEIFPKYTPITSRMMVYAIGIDSQNDNVRITLAANNIENAAEADVVSADGKTFFEALAKAEKAASKEIFLGHTSIILVGQEAARESLAGFIDYTARNFRMRMNIKMLTVMNGTAKEILDLKGEGGNNILSKLDSLINTVVIDENNTAITLNNVVKRMANDKLDPVTICVEVITNEDDGSDELSLSGFAFYDDRTLNSFVTDKAADIYGLLDGNFRIGSLTVNVSEDEKVSMEIITAKTEIKFKDNGVLPKAEVNLDITCGIAEQFDKINGSEAINDRLVEKCKSEIESMLKSDAKELIEFTQKEGIDIFGFVDKYAKYHPYKFAQIKIGAKELYEVMEISVNVTPKITNLYVMQKS